MLKKYIYIYIFCLDSKLAGIKLKFTSPYGRIALKRVNHETTTLVCLLTIFTEICMLKLNGLINENKTAQIVTVGVPI